MPVVAALVVLVGLVLVVARQAGTRAPGVAGGGSAVGPVVTPGPPSSLSQMWNVQPLPGKAEQALRLTEAALGGAAKGIQVVGGPGAAAAAAGTAASAAALGVSAARGDVQGTVTSGLTTVGTGLATLGKAGVISSAATVGGVPVTAAGAQAAAAGATSGTTATGAVAGASIAGAAASLGLVMGVALIIRDILNIVFGWGDRSVKGYIQKRNEAKSEAVNTVVLDAASSAKTLPELLNVLLLSHTVGEGQFIAGHELFGGGGDYRTQPSQTFVEAAQRAAQDETALVQFIKGLRIYTGQGGGASSKNWVLTDWWRRSLASRAGLTKEETERFGLFEPLPPNLTPERMAQSLVDLIQRGGDRGDGELNELVTHLSRGKPIYDPSQPAGRRYAVSTLYREESEYALPAKKRQHYLTLIAEARAERERVGREASTVG